jgi:hypothetical protein
VRGWGGVTLPTPALLDPSTPQWGEGWCWAGRSLSIKPCPHRGGWGGARVVCRMRPLTTNVGWGLDECWLGTGRMLAMNYDFTCSRVSQIARLASFTIYRIFPFSRDTHWFFATSESHFPLNSCEKNCETRLAVNLTLQQLQGILNGYYSSL